MSDRMSATMSDSFAPQAPGRGVRRLVDAVLLNALRSQMRSTLKGRLHLTLPSGRTAVLGQGGGTDASLTLNNYALIWKGMRRGLLGFADAYLSGDFDSADLNALFNFFLDNEKAVTSALPHLMRSARNDRVYHAGRRNTRTGSRRNIAAHYDLGNEFYRLWLDAGMSYSSGIYSSPGATLEQAQAAKHARIVEALELERAHDVLEVGCGWGALAEEIAAHGAHVTAITISQQQHAAAQQRLTGSPHSDRAAVLLQDYRDVTGSFDRIVSIEMIEAVGEDNWSTYFRSIHDRLKPGGLAVIQAITIRDDLYEDYRNKPDFIQRYIFPGGMLPSVQMMCDHATKAGLLISEIEQFGASYALTAAEWRRRFIEAWPRIEVQGFDEKFRRLWIYYLTYCEIGFQHGTIDVGLYVLRKP